MSDMEVKIPISEAARRLRLPARTVRQWGSRGLLDAGAKPIRLRTFRLGGRVYTSAEWANEFLTALNPTEVHPAAA